MPQVVPQVLIVEDEQSAARLITSICAELGLQAAVTGSGREAVALLSQGAQSGAPFACVILDLVLAESDGFQVAQQVRAQPWGAELPIVVISGIYKQLPQEFAQRARPDAFLAKPFEAGQLRETLQRVCNVLPPGSAEGDLAEKPVAALYVELLRQKANGILTLARDGVVRKLYFQPGVLRFGQSNVKAETAGAAQVASGAIKQASFDRAVALARQQKIALHEALAAARVLTLDQLKAALKQQTSEVAGSALAWETGTHKFEPQSPDQINGVPDARVSAIGLILDQARKSGSPEAARVWLEARAQSRMARSPELEREMFSLKGSWPSESVTALATNGRTIGEVLARVKEAELPLLHALCFSGLVTLAASKAAPAPHPSAPKGAGDEDKGKVFSAREHEARRLMFQERERLREANHYQLLGIDKKASPEEVKTAYFKAARRFHSDAFSGLELGSARKVGEELFQRVNEANQILSSAQERSEYDVFLDRKEKGLSTDVAAILKAESIFQKGEVFFNAGKWEDAEAAFREAVALNHAEAEFHAYLGMALFHGRGKPVDALVHVEKALELDPRLPSAQVFTATLKDEQGDAEGARRLLRKVLEQDPDNAMAKAEQTRLRNKGREPAKKSGFFGRLLKK